MRIIAILWAPSGIFLWESFFYLGAAPFQILDEWLLLQRFLLFHDGGPCHTESSSMICSANQQTAFYLLRTSAMKELTMYILRKKIAVYSCSENEEKFSGEQIECRGATRNFSGQGSFLGVTAYPGLQIRRARARKISEKRPFFVRAHFTLLKRKNHLIIQVFSRIG